MAEMEKIETKSVYKIIQIQNWFWHNKQDQQIPRQIKQKKERKYLN